MGKIEILVMKEGSTWSDDDDVSDVCVSTIQNVCVSCQKSVCLSVCTLVSISSKGLKILSHPFVRKGNQNVSRDRKLQRLFNRKYVQVIEHDHYQTHETRINDTWNTYVTLMTDKHD